MALEPSPQLAIIELKSVRSPRGVRVDVLQSPFQFRPENLIFQIVLNG